MFVGSCSGRVYAFEAATGEIVWMYDTSVDGTGQQFHGEALITSDLLVIGSDSLADGHLYAFARADGALRWKHRFPGGVFHDLARHEETVLAVAASGEALAVDLASGEIRWRFADPPARSAGAACGSPALVDGRFIVPWCPGTLDTLDAGTGELLWRRDLGVRLNTSLVVAGDELAMGAVDGRILRLDPETGEPLGDLPGAGLPFGTLVAADGCVLSLRAVGGVVGSGRVAGPFTVSCLEVGPGSSSLEVRWETASEVEWLTFRPLVLEPSSSAPARVIVGSREGLLLLRLADGERLASLPLPAGEIPRGLGASEDTLYVGSLAGPVLALRPGEPWVRP